MGFRLRSLPEIVDSGLATLKTESEGKIDDPNRGSVNRSVIESAALQDADQYVQIGRLKNLFRLRGCRGEDLDERLADYDTSRLPPRGSVGQLRFGDSDLATKVATELSANVSDGDMSLDVLSVIGLPTAGSVILDRDNGLREFVEYTSITGNTLNLPVPLLYAHPTGASVTLSTVGFDRTFPLGTVAKTVATDTIEALSFKTTAISVLKDGDIVTDLVPAVSLATGKILNVDSGAIIELESRPFPTATVTNPSVFTNGSDLETDEEAWDRVETHIQSLSTGNYLALLTAALNVVLPSGERVVSAQVIEEFTDPDVTLYIDNGSGTSQTTDSVTTSEVLVFNAVNGKKRARVSNWPVVTGSLSLRKSTVHGTSDSVAPSGGNFVVTDAGAGFVPSSLIGRIVYDDNRNAFTIVANDANSFTVTSTTAPAVGVYAILATSNLASNEYKFNETTGDIELNVGLSAGGVLVAYPVAGVAYTYYTGLIREVQRVINGVREDPTTYPGIKAQGIKVKVQAPIVLNQTISVTISTEFNIAEESVVQAVIDAIMLYVNSLGIGDTIVIAELIGAIIDVENVTDTRVNTPTSNVVMLDGVLPRTAANLITVL